MEEQMYGKEKKRSVNMLSSKELIKTRKEEIVNACEKLYKTMSFKDITMKVIAKSTTFTRTSIYNYFHTKEEIFLTLTKKEYDLWNKDLTEIIEKNKKLSKDNIAKEIAKSLEKREQMLKLVSMNHFDMEANSRPEILTEFKVSFGNSIKLVSQIIKKFCPKYTNTQVREFVYSFFPFVYGIYPYAIVNTEQKKAMEKAKVGYTYHTIYELAYSCVKKLL
jgi:AcrR family transcriptional regulator